MPQTEARNERVLILAPTGRDAELACGALRSAGLFAETVADIDALCRGVEEGCGALLITEEALNRNAMQCLRDELERLPAWSDPPLLVFTSRPSAELAVPSFEQAGFDVHLTKPADSVDLQNVLAHASPHGSGDNFANSHVGERR